MSDGGKGSARRPGEGYSEAWERIFGKKSETPKDQPKPSDPKDKPAEQKQ